MTKIHSINRFISRGKPGGICILPILFLFTITPLFAQAPDEPMFFSGAPIMNVSWTTDGKILTFQEGWGSDMEIGVFNTQSDQSWHQYFADGPNKGLITSEAVWPQHDYSAEDIQKLDLASNSTGQISFSFPSPDNRYIVYAISKVNADDYGWPLAITDQKTNTSQIIDGPRVNSLGNFEGFYRVTWSRNSAAFTVRTDSTFAWNPLHYVTGFTDGLDKLTVVEITAGITINDEIRQPLETFGISSDGSQVLVQDRHLWVWNVEKPLESELVVEDSHSQVIEAVFSALSDEKVLYVSEKGLVEYDRTNHISTLLDPTINSTWANKAWISPNGSHIALLDSNDFGQGFLYVVDIKANP